MTTTRLDGVTRDFGLDKDIKVVGRPTRRRRARAERGLTHAEQVEREASGDTHRPAANRGDRSLDVTHKREVSGCRPRQREQFAK